MFNLYTRYQFNFNQLLLAKENYKTLENPSQRALIYQKMILTTEPNEKLLLAQLLKNLFDNDNLGNAFNTELSKILLSIDETKISSDLLSFYKKIYYQKDILKQN